MGVAICILIVFILRYVENVLTLYTETDTAVINSWENSEVLMDQELALDLLYKSDQCDIEIWIYSNELWNDTWKQDSVDMLYVLSNRQQMNRMINEIPSVRISENVSKKLFNSVMIQNEQINLNGYSFNIQGVSSKIESRRVGEILDTKKFIVVNGNLNNLDSSKRWSVFISGFSENVEKEISRLSSVNISKVQFDKSVLRKILRTVSLISIILYWSLIGSVIYLCLDLILFNIIQRFALQKN